MADRIVIENRRGCGCGSFLALLLLAGLAINYWYVAAPLAVALLGAWAWVSFYRPAQAVTGSYECPRCHGGITKGTTACLTCGYDVRDS